MPVISRFFGVDIFMLWRDHQPAHFHARYGDHEITVEIENGKTVGTMSPRALKLIQEWRELHKDELLKDWECAVQKKALFPIEPLE